MTQETVTLVIEPRTVIGKAVKHLRTQGQVPVVIHDHGKESILAQAEYMAAMKAWKRAGKNHPINLTTGGKSYVALIKTAEFDPRKNMLTHIVFNAVDAKQKVEAAVPVHPKYAEGNESSPAERSGFIVLTQADTVMVEAIATKLPDALYYDAEKLVEVGDSASVTDLVIPEGVIVKTDESQSLATVYEPSALAAANDAVGGEADEADVEAAAEAAAVEAAEAEATEKPAE